MLNEPQCPQWILLVAVITIAVVSGRHSPVIYGALWCPCCITGPGEVNDVISFSKELNTDLVSGNQHLAGAAVSKPCF